MIRALAASVLALGFAGTALADRDHGRDNDRGRWERYERDRHNDRRDDRRYDNRRDYGRYERPRVYRAPPPPPRYDYRWRAPRPYGWHPGWREPYGRGYRYWNDDFYYVVPGPPSIGLSLTLPIR
ncbi:MAG: hypothetical protein ABW136_11810 [Steroidobacteraceae bacterium]